MPWDAATGPLRYARKVGVTLRGGRGIWMRMEPRETPVEVDWCERLLPAARLFAIRHVGWTDGEDIAQEAIALLLGAVRAGRISDEAQAGAFLLGTCRNLARSHARKTHRRDALLQREAPSMTRVTGA